MTVAIYYETPHILGNHAKDIRDSYVRNGFVFGRSACLIGWDGPLVKIACVEGGVEFEFQPDGRIFRRSVGQYCKLVEWVAADIARYVDMHNETLKKEDK